jgi:tetratricopeptide (TPR) repeat protein
MSDASIAAAAAFARSGAALDDLDVVGSGNSRVERRVAPLEPHELDDLDRLAPEALTRGLPSRLVGVIDQLLESDLTGHPWSQLLASAVCHDTYRGDRRALALCREAWAGFEAVGDRNGLGVAANVRANLLLSQGDVGRAVSWWRRADALLGEDTDLNASVAAHSSLEAYARGDLASAERLAQEALLLADASGQPGAAAVPLVYLALYAYCLGEFERAAGILETAEAMTASSSVAEIRNEGALVAAFTGVLLAVRGRRSEADCSFATGLARAAADDAPWYATMVRALRAEFTAEWAPHRSLLDARRALEEAEATGDTWWSGLARMAEGTALAELGELTEARDVLTDAAAHLRNPIERAFAQTHLGEVLVRLGDRGPARIVLNAARAACESAGARYWATRTTLAMGAADRDRGGRWIRLARSTAVDDPAYDRLFSPTQELRVAVLDSPEVWLRGEPVEFLTRHAELAVYLLAIAGPSGVPAAELAAALWPGVDERRTGPRLRTLLWQARNALGTEAWRVQRRNGSVFLDLTGVAVDLHEVVLAHQEKLAAADLDHGSRAAAPDGGTGGDGGTVTTGRLLDGWDVELPPSFGKPPIADGLDRFR